MEVDRADTVAEEATDVTQEISLNTSAEEDAAIEHRKQKLREEITEVRPRLLYFDFFLGKSVNAISNYYYCYDVQRCISLMPSLTCRLH